MKKIKALVLVYTIPFIGSFGGSFESCKTYFKEVKASVCKSIDMFGTAVLELVPINKEAVCIRLNLISDLKQIAQKRKHQNFSGFGTLRATICPLDLSRFINIISSIEIIVGNTVNNKKTIVTNKFKVAWEYRFYKSVNKITDHYNCDFALEIENTENIPASALL
jgi:hypothetical protein